MFSLLNGFLLLCFVFFFDLFVMSDESFLQRLPFHERDVAEVHGARADEPRGQGGCVRRVCVVRVCVCVVRVLCVCVCAPPCIHAAMSSQPAFIDAIGPKILKADLHGAYIKVKTLALLRLLLLLLLLLLSSSSSSSSSLSLSLR